MREMTDNVVTTDVLIVGGGGAGFRAAIGAREKGARATLVSKGALARESQYRADRMLSDSAQGGLDLHQSSSR